jgi:hypothetical protein
VDLKILGPIKKLISILSAEQTFARHNTVRPAKAPASDENSGTRVQFLLQEIFRIETKHTHLPTHASVQLHFYKRQQQCHQSSFILSPGTCCQLHLLQASTPTISGTPLGIADLVLVQRILCCSFNVYVAPLSVDVCLLI